MHPLPPIESLLELALNAGRAILAIYYDSTLMNQVVLKQDASPLTLADQASHNIIVNGLQILTPDIPVLSEEGAAIPYEIRKHWEYCWCVDPLDGTKEFLLRNNEFTVNIALIHRWQPVFGIIYLPVSQTLYYGSYAIGSWKKTENSEPAPLHTDKQAKEWIAVGSRSHTNPREKAVLSLYPVVKHIVAGSALKFGLIAEGTAHIYIRQVPTMEWDTAAGHAIVQSAGGDLFTDSGEPFLYNKESLINGPFICMAARRQPQRFL